MGAPTSKTPLLVELRIRIKTYDIDFVGHVNNIVYIRWLEDLRLEFLDAHLPLGPLQEQGIAPIVVSTNIHYRQGIFLSDQHVLGRMWISEMQRASFFLAAEFVVDGEVRCSATQRGTLIDTARNRPIRIPAHLREAFTKDFEASEK